MPPHLALSGKLEFFCSLKEKKKKNIFYSDLIEVLCFPTRGQTTNEVSRPSQQPPADLVLTGQVRVSVD